MERHSPGVVQDTRDGTAVVRYPVAVRSERVRGSRVRVLPGRQGELRGRQDLQGWRQGWWVVLALGPIHSKRKKE